jgi:phthiodiolone/phenolphthiodiolone dimycocerosates ketoreductase
LLKLRFGLFLSAADINGVIEQGILAEKEQFDSIWVPDHLADVPPSVDRYEPWAVLAAIGARTEQIRVGTLVTDCVRRHSASIAHVAASVDNITHGRVILGIGTGEAMNVKPYGLPWEDSQTRLARLRETVQVIRLLWKSSLMFPVNFLGQFHHLTGARLDVHPYTDRSIPIFVGSLGSRRSLELVAEVADGWLPWFNTPDSFLERRQVIDGTAKQKGRSPDEIEKTAIVCLCLSADQDIQKRILNFVKTEVAMFPGARKVARFDHLAKPNFSFQEILASIADSERAKRLGETLSDALARKFLVAGTVGECVSQLEELVRVGAQHIIIRNMLYGVEEFDTTIRRIGREVIHSFR